MKLLRQAILVALLVGLPLPSFAQVVGGVKNPATPQLIVPPKGGLTADDYAVELAKTANRNLIMDATDVSTAFQMPSYPANPTPDLIPVYEFVLQFFRGNAGLSEELHGKTTLLWKAPYLEEFATAIAASDVLAQTDPLEVPEEAQLLSDLVESARKDNGWTKNAAIGDYNHQEIKIVDLPENLRSRVMRFAHQETAAAPGDYRAWLSDDFWKTALLRPGGIETSSPQGKHIMSIEISSAPSPDGKISPFYEVLPRGRAMKPSTFSNKQLADLYDNIRKQLQAERQ